MAFVVPAEIGHAPYAAPVLEYLVARFAAVHVVAVRDKLFPELSEDCWLLYAEGFGAHTAEICFSVLDTFVPMSAPPQQGIKVSLREWHESWNRRLRPFILPAAGREPNLVRNEAGCTCTNSVHGVGYGTATRSPV